MKILIVDDSKTARMITKRTLRRAGYGEHDILEANDGREAIDVVKENSPDLILCDWNMPEMNGMQFLYALKVLQINIPFGLITTEGSDENRIAAADAGADFLLLKHELKDVTLKNELDKIFGN